MKLDTEDFDYVCIMAKQEAALVFESGKEYLIESRLVPVAKEHGFTTLKSFIDRMRKGTLSSEVKQKFLNVLTTNETYFFRDFHPFESLRDHILPELIEKCRATKKINIWSAACSSGQEVYTFMMLLREHFPELDDWEIRVVASDISTTVLNQAQTGIYNQVEVNRGLPARLLVKYFRKENDRWVVHESLRQGVEFRSINLISPWPILPPMDIVFLRNVMIYFDVTTKQAILKKMRQVLKSERYLFLGGAETTLHLDNAFTPTQHGKTIVYKTPAA